MTPRRPGIGDDMMSWMRPPVSYGLAVRKVQNVTILDLRGSLSQDRSSQGLNRQISDLLAAGSRHLAINLGKVTYIDSTGLGALLVAHNTISHAGGTCVFFGVGEHTRQLLHRVHLDAIFTIFDDEASVVSNC